MVWPKEYIRNRSLTSCIFRRGLAADFHGGSAMKATRLGGRRVVVVDGVRTPFVRSGTVFSEMSAYDLGRCAVSALLHRTGLDPGEVDLLVYGNVIQDCNTSNLAREVGLASGLPEKVPAYTVTVACISANLAFETARGPSPSVKRRWPSPARGGDSERRADPSEQAHEEAPHRLPRRPVGPWGS